MESIKENQQKSKGMVLWVGLKSHIGRIKLGIVVILLAVASFGLGRLSTVVENRDYGQVYLAQSQQLQGQQLQANVVSSPIVESTAQNNSLPIQKNYVAARTGKVYYLPTCGGVSRIKEENKVYFATKTAAEAAGYSPAANCPGLK